MTATRVLAVLIIAAALVAGVLASPRALDAQRNAPPPAKVSQCTLTTSKVAAPDLILLGETTNVTLTVSGSCPSQDAIHIVLVLDRSGSMEGEANKQLRRAGIQFVRSLRMRNHPGIKVGVVQFNERAQTLCELTNSEGKVVSCISRVGGGGCTHIYDGMSEGLEVLEKGRPRGRGSRCIPFAEFMLVFTDGVNECPMNGCPPNTRVAGRIKGENIHLSTMCLNSMHVCDSGCMRQMASSPRDYYEVANAGGLAAAFQEAFVRIRRSSEVAVGQLTVVDRLPPDMQLVPDSALPVPDRVDDAGAITWAKQRLPRDGLTLTFKLQPLEVGLHPTNLGASGVFTDTQGCVGQIPFDVPSVMVLQPFPRAIPTAPPPTPTFTAVPPTQIPTSTVTPPPIATPTPWPIYLPLVVNESCEQQWVYADVALVLDVSTSMNRSTRAGRSKLAATQDAAKTFIGLMDFTPNALGQHDQVAVVGFNREAWVAQSLSNDVPAIRRAIDDLPQRQAEGTRLDLAFEQGAEALRPERRLPGNTPVLILLTDGLPNQVPPADDGSVETTVLRSAQKAKSGGIRVYTIAIGAADDTNPNLLKACATDPTMYHYTPDPEDLGRIYTEIAYSFGCPGERFWGGR